ncbi:hypothetical protein TWF481_002387 [Arthrobotrys musiformis]|uniref:F-box domain-containing protein n=1 Tax=Arthrobotrys musiformis TaxID=47236 RepID=A0AAV9VT05_9PEZI
MTSNSISALPTEVLIQIFNDKALNSSDLINCARSCSRFRDVIYYSGSCGLQFTFQVDHLSQSAWEFARQVLADPQVALRVSKIRLTWYRRRRRWDNTWTETWRWTEEELSQIYDTCEEWKIRSVYPAIRDGFNSEALLPLLLCYTTKLKSLDLGNVDPEFIVNLKYGYRMGDVRRIFDYNRLGWEKWDIQRWYDSGGATFNGRGRAERNCVLWVYSTMTPEPWLPGFASLKEFSSGAAERTRYQQISFDWTPIKHLSKITALPRLETLTLRNMGGRRTLNYDSDEGIASLWEQNPDSSVKHLELINCAWRESLCRKIALLTRNSLESFTYLAAPGTCNGYLYDREWRSEGYNCEEIREARIIMENEVIGYFRQAKMRKLAQGDIKFLEYVYRSFHRNLNATTDEPDYEFEDDDSGWDTCEDMEMSEMDPYLSWKRKHLNSDSEDELGREQWDYTEIRRSEGPESDYMYDAPQKKRQIKGLKTRSHFVGEGGVQIL